MWINRISFLIIVFLLGRHLIRIIRVWRVSHTISVTSALFIVAMALLLIALLTVHDWTKWLAAVFLILIAIWKFRGPGAILDQCEDALIIGGIPHAEMEEFSREQDAKEELYEAEKERERQIKADREAWWEAFAVEAHPREVEFSVDLYQPIDLDTDEDEPLVIGPGETQLSFDGWHPGSHREDERYEIEIDLTVPGPNASLWQSRYAITIERLVEIGFSEEPKRKPEDLVAWSEIDPVSERAFREHCLVSKASYRTDLRDRIDVKIGRHHYLVVTKHQRGVIDLAWEPESKRFLLRLAGLHFKTRDGNEELEVLPEAEGPVPSPWEPYDIEPVVFPILPAEMLPFGLKGITPPWQYNYEVEKWLPPFTRRTDRT